MNYVIANLKMNFVTTEECDHYISVLNQEWNKKKSDNVQLVVCPSTIYMDRFVKGLSKGIAIGGQNAFWEDRGSYTGETSPLSLKNAGARYVILGHSERRLYFHETSEIIAAKIQAAIKNGLKFIVCIGETKEEREQGSIADVIREQLEESLQQVSLLHLKDCIIAYEPRWAIGSDVTPSSHEIMQIRVLIRKILSEKYGLDAIEKIPLLYGGSAKASLIDRVCKDPGMDGVLVGREGLVPHEVSALIHALC